MPTMLASLSLPTLLTIGTTAFFLLLERVAPGRELPRVRHWYLRALGLNLVQMLLTLAMNHVWRRVFMGDSLLQVAAWNAPVLEGLCAWFVGTFFFYWWHRLRHAAGFRRIFHQVHHSPARIEVVTSFYKHRIEMLADLPLWDRLFGTYKDATDFAPACGFPRDNERHLSEMLAFRDVYDRP